MKNQSHNDPRPSDKIEADEDEIIDLTEVVEVKPQKSLEKEISPDDFPDDEGFELSDDADMAGVDPEPFPEPAVFNSDEAPEEALEAEPPAAEKPEPPPVDETNAVSDEAEDLGTLVSEITGTAPDTEPPLQGIEDVTTAQLDAAVEKAVEKIFTEKIEARIMALFESVVKREIDKITELIEKKAKED